MDFGSNEPKGRNRQGRVRIRAVWGGGGEERNHPRRKAKESSYCVHVAGSRRRLGKASGVWEN